MLLLIARGGAGHAWRRLPFVCTRFSRAHPLRLGFAQARIRPIRVYAGFVGGSSDRAASRERRIAYRLRPDPREYPASSHPGFRGHLARRPVRYLPGFGWRLRCRGMPLFSVGVPLGRSLKDYMTPGTRRHFGSLRVHTIDKARPVFTVKVILVCVRPCDVVSSVIRRQIYTIGFVIRCDDNPTTIQARTPNGPFRSPIQSRLCSALVLASGSACLKYRRAPTAPAPRPA